MTGILSAMFTGGGGGGYVAKAVHFDGSTFLNTSSLTSTDNEFFSMSGWFNVADWSSFPTIFVSDPTQGNNEVTGDGANKVIGGVSDNGGNSATVITPPIVTAAWHNIIISTQTNFGPSPSEWYVASSSDGTKQFAAGTGDFIYSSSDSGATWTKQAGSGSNAWTSIVCSANGIKVFAVGPDSNVYISTDSGVTWNPVDTGGGETLTAVCCSSNGSVVLAVAGGGHLYVSSNSGSSWTQRGTVQSWGIPAMTADGTTLMLAPAVDNSGLWLSVNGGTTWIANPVIPTRGWQSVAVSSDGAKIVAGSYDGSGIVALSTNGGLTWANIGPDASSQWYSLTATANFSKIAGVPNPGFVYTTINSGTSWQHAVTQNFYNWVSVAGSADLSIIIASASQDGGKVHVSSDGGASWHGPQVSNSKRVTCYVDGVQAIQNIRDSNPSFDIAFNGIPLYIGADTFGDNLIGDVADLWIAPGVSLVQLDGTISPTNLAKFIDPSTKKPVDPSGFPSAPMLFSGDHTTFPTNQGTGGAFTLTGTLTDASSSPSD